MQTEINSVIEAAQRIQRGVNARSDAETLAHHILAAKAAPTNEPVAEVAETGVAPIDIVQQSALRTALESLRDQPMWIGVRCGNSTWGIGPKGGSIIFEVRCRQGGVDDVDNIADITTLLNSRNHILGVFAVIDAYRRGQKQLREAGEKALAERDAALERARIADAVTAVTLEGSELREERDALALRVTEMEALLKKYVHASGRIVDKFSESCPEVQQALWQDLHKLEETARAALATSEARP